MTGPATRKRWRTAAWTGGIVVYTVGAWLACGAVLDSACCSQQTEQVVWSPSRTARVEVVYDLCGGAAGAVFGFVYVIDGGEKRTRVLEFSHGTPIRVTWHGDERLTLEYDPKESSISEVRSNAGPIRVEHGRP